ncbi:unnamed protein product, partial [Ectocarpus sp. 12 AP-2014]
SQRTQRTPTPDSIRQNNPRLARIHILEQARPLSTSVTVKRPCRQQVRPKDQVGIMSFRNSACDVTKRHSMFVPKRSAISVLNSAELHSGFRNTPMYPGAASPLCTMVECRFNTTIS